MKDPEYERSRQRAWRLANPEKMRARKQRYRERHKARLLEQERAWRAANRDALNERSRERYAADPEQWRRKALDWANANREKVRERQREIYAANPEKKRREAREWLAKHPDRKHAHYIANRERINATNAAWAKANPEAKRAFTRNRRARLKGAAGKHTAQDVKDQYKRQRGKCFWCKARLSGRYHVDHVIPISKGGRNSRENIVIACPTCNMEKSARMPAEFAGRLL